jgi:hypothetical protein
MQRRSVLGAPRCSRRASISLPPANLEGSVNDYSISEWRARPHSPLLYIMPFMARDPDRQRPGSPSIRPGGWASPRACPGRRAHRARIHTEQRPAAAWCPGSATGSSRRPTCRVGYLRPDSYLLVRFAILLRSLLTLPCERPEHSREGHRAGRMTYGRVARSTSSVRAPESRCRETRIPAFAFVKGLLRWIRITSQRRGIRDVYHREPSGTAR